MINTTWIYPPNWDGIYPTEHGFRRGTVLLTSHDELDNEESSTKINLSNLKTLGGASASKVAIDRITYDIAGFDQIRIYFDDEEQTPIAILGAGSGEIDFSVVGGIVSPYTIPDVESEDYTGDIMLTTSLQSEGAGSYSISMTIRPKA